MKCNADQELFKGMHIDMMTTKKSPLNQLIKINKFRTVLHDATINIIKIKRHYITHACVHSHPLRTIKGF